jgi:hypothetical protein
MPNNNPGGVNAFSGPQGRSDPAYGAVERLKVLSALAPIGSPAAIGAPKRAQRRAGKRAPQQAASPAAAPSVAQAPQATYGATLASFWQQLAADPGASNLVRQLAQEAQGAV